MTRKTQSDATNFDPFIFYIALGMIIVLLSIITEYAAEIAYSLKTLAGQ